MNDVAHKVFREAIAARDLRQAIVDTIHDTNHPDDLHEVLFSAVEGETNLLETVDDALARLAALETYSDALREQERSLAARRARFERQQDKLREALLTALNTIGERRMERPTATIYVTKERPRVLIEEDSAIPDAYCQIKRTPDKEVIRKALDLGLPVEGATLSIPRGTLAIRRG